MKLDRGGNDITDVIGRQTFGSGYDGILFFSARAIGEQDWRWISEPHHFTRLHFDIEQLATNDDHLALVIFSMSTIARKTHWYVDADAVSQQNPYRRWSPERIEQLSSFNAEYQLEQLQRSIVVQKPSFEEGPRFLVDEDRKNWW